jgi:hypothetical protein
MQKIYYFFLILVLSFIFLGQIVAQSSVCQVIDSQSGNPLAFVNIRFNNSQKGTISDVNGRFSVNETVSSLHLFYVGYRDTIIYTKNNKFPSTLSMQSKVTELETVEILPSENPAFRIIKRAIENRKINRPENLKAFSYVSYNKMIFTAQPDTIALLKNDSIAIDSFKYRLSEFINRQHFLIMESVSKRSFLGGKNHELVKVSKVSGLKDPFFMLLASQFQSFSFYEPQFNILGKNYINPLIPSSLSNYFFQLQDTLYQGDDTVFIIVFRPLKNKQFDGLKGFVYINTDGFAVQNVIAEPMEADTIIGVKIQQLYEKIDGKAWFPTQLNTTLSFGSVLVNDYPVMGLGTTYLDSILINPNLSKTIFRGKVTVEFAKNDEKSIEPILNPYRKDSLTNRDINTYLFMDSLGEAENLDFKIKMLQILASGKIPVWKLAIPIDKLFSYNDFEKWRFGLGLETSEIMSKYFNLSTYLGFSTGDKVFKYSGKLTLTPVPNSDFKISMGYLNDLEESGSAYKFNPSFFISSDNYRQILIDKMNRTEDIFSEVQFRAAKYFVFKIEGKYSRKTVTDNYLYKLAENGTTSVYGSNFDVLTLSAGLKFAWGEKLVRNPDKLISMGTKYPILNINLIHGIKSNISNFNYYKIDFQLNKIFKMRYLGESDMNLKAGFINRDLPSYLLYNSQGSYANFFPYSFESFNTMKVNEFLSDKYISFFWQHNFGKRIFKKNKYFAPDWLLVNNIGFGTLSKSENHKNIDFKTMEKGYYETGLLWGRILTSNIANIGFGAFYRYGPNSNSTVKENISYRMVVGFIF